METHLWQSEQIETAAQALKNGEVVAFPTETVYGLGADATNNDAVKKIFLAKGRPNDNPLIIHVANEDQVEAYAQYVPKKAKLVMEHLWPGPCTIILEKKGPLASSVTGGLDTVGIRMPDHPIALKLIEKAGKPLAAPSANSSGKPSPTSADHVRADLDGKIAGIVDGGETGVGLESTVLDLTDSKRPTILRPGGVSLEDLEKVIGKVYMDTYLFNSEMIPKSPGMKYRHYSPDKRVWILPFSKKESRQLVLDLQNNGEVVGVIASEEQRLELETKQTVFFSLGSKKSPEKAASLLYKALRAVDESRATIIVVEPFEKKGIGTAYMNRLEKAAERIL